MFSCLWQKLTRPSNTWHITYDKQHMTYDMWQNKQYMIHDTWHTKNVTWDPTHETQHTANKSQQTKHKTQNTKHTPDMRGHSASSPDLGAQTDTLLCSRSGCGGLMLPGGQNTLDTLASDSCSSYFSYFLSSGYSSPPQSPCICLSSCSSTCPGGLGWGCDQCDFRRSREEVEELEEAMREAIASREANLPWVSSQQSAVSSQLSAVSCQLSAVSCQLSAQSAVSSHQSPVTSHQSPVTSHQSPVTSHLSPATSHLSLSTQLEGRQNCHWKDHWPRENRRGFTQESLYSWLNKTAQCNAVNLIKLN